MENNLFVIDGVQSLTEKEAVTIDGGIIVPLLWWLGGSLAWELINGNGASDFYRGWSDGAGG